MQTDGFGGILSILLKRLWLILLVCAGTMAVVLVVSSRTPLRYRASVKVQVIAVEQEQVTLFGDVRSTGTTEQILSIIGAFMNDLQDARIAWQTIGNLQLPMDAAALRQRLHISRVGEFVTVQADGDTPQQAESIATAHVENARKYHVEVHARPAVVAGEFINKVLVEQEQQLNLAKEALLKFELQHNLISLDQEIAAYRSLILSTRQSRESATLEAARATTLATEWNKAADAATAQAATYRVKAAEERAKARAALKTAREEAAKEAAKETATKTPVPQAPIEGDPEAEIAAALAAKQADDADALERAYRTNAINQQAMETEQRGLANQYEQLSAQREAELATLIGLSAEYQGLTDAVQRTQGDYDFLRGKATEAELKTKQNLELGYLKVVEPARVPETPVARATMRIAVVAAVVSLMAGIILAFILEFIVSLTGTPRGTRGSQ